MHMNKLLVRLPFDGFPGFELVSSIVDDEVTPQSKNAVLASLGIRGRRKAKASVVGGGFDV